MKNVCFYEREYLNRQINRSRIDFQDFVKAKNIDFYHIGNESELFDYKVIFCHGSDFINIESTDVQDVIFVLWGGFNSSENGNIENNTIRYLNYNDLKVRLDDLIQIFDSSKEFDVLELSNVIFKIDNNLENILKPFVTLSPFALVTDKIKDKEGNLITVEEAYNKLAKYLKNKK